jgi:hypothetical protein
MKLLNRAKKHFGFLPPSLSGVFPGAIIEGDTVGIWSQPTSSSLKNHLEPPREVHKKPVARI